MKQQLFILLFGLSIFSFGQNNLVPNGSFEIYSTCPSNLSEIEKASNWFQPNSIVSSDYFHSCNTFVVSVPNNQMGNQTAYEGNAYAGLILYSYPATPSLREYREYLEYKLVNPLEKDYTYCVEFYVSLSDNHNYAISSIGSLFTYDSVLTYCSNPCLIINTPHVQNDSLNIITDKLNWTKIAGTIIAQGGEQYITIGNFNNDKTTERHYQKVSNIFNSNFSYYYIDNVSVYACDSPLVEEPQDTTFIFIPNVFSPNQDGENDLWEVTASKVNSLYIQVFNRWGEQVYIFNSQSLQQDTSSTLSVTYNPAWDGHTPTGKPVPEGTYFYIVQYTLPSGETKVEKGHLTLIR